MKRVIAGLLGCVAIAMGGGVGTGHEGEPEQFGPWSAAVNLGAVVNSSVRDTPGSISRGTDCRCISARLELLPTGRICSSRAASRSICPGGRRQRSTC